MITNTLSSYICNLVIEKKDGSRFQSGSGVIIVDKGYYYLVTAKHNLMEGATQIGKQVPTPESSANKIYLLNEEIRLVHSEVLVDDKQNQVVYKVWYIEEDKALDIAVLRLNYPNDLTISMAIESSIIEDSNEILQENNLLCAGFLSDIDDELYYLKSSALHISQQNLLDKENEFYFLIAKNEHDLKGISGAPVFSIPKQKIIGFLVGQNRSQPIAYVIFSKFVLRCLELFTEK